MPRAVSFIQEGTISETRKAGNMAWRHSVWPVSVVIALIGPHSEDFVGAIEAGGACRSFPRFPRPVAWRGGFSRIGSARCRTWCVTSLTGGLGSWRIFYPSGGGRSAPTAADATVITPIGAASQGVEAVAVGLRRNGKETVLGQFALSGSGLAELPRAAGKPVVLRLSDADMLGKPWSCRLQQNARSIRPWPSRWIGRHRSGPKNYTGAIGF